MFQTIMRFLILVLFPVFLFAAPPKERPWEKQPYLGLSFSDHPQGCIVSWVLPGPLRHAGLPDPLLRRGDLILAVNGQPMKSDELSKLLQQAKPGDSFLLQVRKTGGDPESAMPSPGQKNVEEEIRVTLSSKGHWCGPIQFTPPAESSGPPDRALPPLETPTALERFLSVQLEAQKIREPVEKLQKLFSESQQEVFGYHSLRHVAYAFHHPTRLPQLQKAITDGLAGLPADPRLVFAEAAKILDVSAPATGERMDLSDPEKALAEISAAAQESAQKLGQAFAGVDKKRQQALAGPLKEILAFEEDIAGLPDPLLFLRALQGTVDVDYAALLASGARLSGLMLKAEKPKTDARKAKIPLKIRKAVTGEVLAVRHEGGRWLVFGGGGPNSYDLSKIDIVVDAGGDDVYYYSAEARPRIQLVIDCSGNDRYTSAGACGPAGACLGVSLLVDHEGNDTYEGNFLSCGASLLGVGVIVDHDGADRYSGTTCSQGAGYYGLGAVLDLGGGSDTYTAQVTSQGLGGPKGFGLLLDAWGSDFYRAYGPTPSAYGTPAVYFAMSQGVGYGIRGYDSGGVGVLCDFGGEDRYEAGEFSQGGGYYWGLGILYDRSGNDLYFGDRYGQGYGCHQACGVLADDQGDDTYWAQCAACQGGAWDIGMGILIDRQGNDAYRADGLSQGGAAMQAIAWLIDLDGTDRYTAAPGATHGQSSGNSYHYNETGCFSFSLLLDIGGANDYYSTGRPNGQTLSTGSLNEGSPADSGLHGLYIDTNEKMNLMP